MWRSAQSPLVESGKPKGVLIHSKVYSAHVTRTNIEIDDELVERVMRIYRLRSKRDAVDLALRKLVNGMSREEVLAAEGSGWSGDLDEIRSREEIPEL
jgi:Arc/MetJ family transcription regulator